MFLERLHKSNNIWTSFYLGWKLHNLEEKSGSESKKNRENKILIYQGKILINKSWLNFWGVITLPPLRKIPSSRFAKGCFEKKNSYYLK